MVMFRMPIPPIFYHVFSCINHFCLVILSCIHWGTKILLVRLCHAFSTFNGFHSLLYQYVLHLSVAFFSVCFHSVYAFCFFVSWNDLFVFLLACFLTLVLTTLQLYMRQQVDHKVIFFVGFLYLLAVIFQTCHSSCSDWYLQKRGSFTWWFLTLQMSTLIIKIKKLLCFPFCGLRELKEKFVTSSSIEMPFPFILVNCEK